MNKSTNLYKQFSDTTDEILEKIDVPTNDGTVKKNLLSSTTINFSRLLSEKAEGKKIIEKLESKNLSSSQEFEKVVEEISSKLAIETAPLETILKQAMKESLEDFISNLAKKLPQEKTEELRKIKNKYI